MASNRSTKFNSAARKFQNSMNGTDPNIKVKPSELLTQSAVDVAMEDYPMIVEFVNIQDNTTQVHSSVDVDRPLFHPNPVVVVFEEYSSFTIHERKLFFRNNDRVRFDFSFFCCV